MKSLFIYALILLFIFPSCTEEPSTVDDTISDKLKSIVVLREGETETFSFEYQEDFITKISIVRSDGARNSYQFFYDQGKLISKKVNIDGNSEVANITYFEDKYLIYKFGTDSILYDVNEEGDIDFSEKFEFSDERQFFLPVNAKEYEWSDGNCKKITTLYYDENIYIDESLTTTVNLTYDTLKNPFQIYQGIPITDDLLHDYELITFAENNVTSQTSEEYEIHYQYEYNEKDFPSLLTIKSIEVNSTDTLKSLITFEY